MFVLKVSVKPHERLADLTFDSVCPLCVPKVEEIGCSQVDFPPVLAWLPGFDELRLPDLINKKATFETFFLNAELNPNAHLIKGVICGYRIEEIDNSLTQQVRFLDKLVDELAKGRKMEKILRK